MESSIKIHSPEDGVQTQYVDREVIIEKEVPGPERIVEKPVVVTTENKTVVVEKDAGFLRKEVNDLTENVIRLNNSLLQKFEQIKPKFESGEIEKILNLFQESLHKSLNGIGIDLKQIKIDTSNTYQSYREVKEDLQDLQKTEDISVKKIDQQREELQSIYNGLNNSLKAISNKKLDFTPHEQKILKAVEDVNKEFVFAVGKLDNLIKSTGEINKGLLNHIKSDLQNLSFAITRNIEALNFNPESVSGPVISTIEDGLNRLQKILVITITDLFESRVTEDIDSKMQLLESFVIDGFDKYEESLNEQLNKFFEFGRDIRDQFEMLHNRLNGFNEKFQKIETVFEEKFELTNSLLEGKLENGLQYFNARVENEFQNILTFLESIQQIIQIQGMPVVDDVGDHPQIFKDKISEYCSKPAFIDSVPYRKDLPNSEEYNNRIILVRMNDAWYKPFTKGLYVSVSGHWIKL